NVKLFEFGKSYHKYANETVEKKHLTLLISGNRSTENWRVKEEKSDFFYLKGIVISILERLGISNVKTRPTKNDVFTEGISFTAGEDLLVELGILKRNILKHFDIKQEVLFADFNWSKVIEAAARNETRFSDIPKYPEVRRDLALLLDN